MIDVSDLGEAAAVVAALETLLYAVEDSLQAISERAVEHLDGMVESLVDSIAPAVERSLLAIDVNLPGESEPGPLDWSAADRATAQVADLIVGPEAELGALVDRAHASIEAAVAASLPGIPDILSAIIKVFTSLVEAFSTSLVEAPEFWQEAAKIWMDAIAVHQGGIGLGVVEVLRHVFTDERSQNVFVGSAGDWASFLIANVTPRRTDTVEEWYAGIQRQPAFVSGIMNVASLFAGIITILNARIAGFVSGVTQTSMMESMTTPLSASEVASLLKRERIGEDFAKSMAARTGVSPELLALKVAEMDRLLDTQAILEYWRRTDDGEVLKELGLSGYSESDIERLKILSLSVPTASDVVRFLARDVFDKDAIIFGKLDDQFDKKYDEKIFNAAGVTYDTAKLYWMAHWSLPSPTMGYEMLHRDILTPDQLQDLLKLADYAPGWVDKMMQISYNVPGRIDVRRMWETGIITDRDELVKRYQFMGYSPADADTLASFTERLAETSKSHAAEREHGPVVHEIVRSFLVGTMSDVSALEALSTLGLTPEQAAAKLAEGEFGRERDRADRIRDAIGRQYVRGFAEKAEVESRLSSYGFAGAEISFLTDSWDLDRELAEETEAKKHERDLSKSEVISAYEERLTTRADAAANLVGLGYSAEEAGTLLALADTKRAKADNAVVERSIHSAYITRRIESGAAAQALAELGYLQPRIAALMLRWEIEREERRPDLTPAQLERMLMQGVVPIETIEEHLRARGYTETDINMLLTLFGTDKALAVEQLEERRREFDIREKRLTEQGAQRIGLTSRGLDIRETQFTARESGVQSRFDAAQETTRNLQQARLDQQSVLQAQRLAAQTERDAASFQASQERQERQIAAAADRTQKQIEAANGRADAATAARDRALAQARDLAAQAQAAAGTRQATALTAASERQRIAAENAAARAQQAALYKSALQDQAARHTQDLTALRATIQEARDIRLNAQRIGQENRAELQRVRTEQRSSARRDIGTSVAAANAADLQSLQLQQSQAVADVTSRFAALQAQLAQQRGQQALDMRQAAERLLAASTPATTLLDTAGY